MAQMKPYIVPMKNLTLLCGKEYPFRKVFKKWMWAPFVDSGCLVVIRGNYQEQIVKWQWLWSVNIKWKSQNFVLSLVPFFQLSYLTTTWFLSSFIAWQQDGPCQLRVLSQFKEPFVGEGFQGSHEQRNRRLKSSHTLKVGNSSRNLIVTIPAPRIKWTTLPTSNSSVHQEFF